MSKGFIALHRSIQDHWIFENESYFYAWIIILMEVNHKEKKVLINDSVMTCKRGESLLSKSNWAKKFGKSWNRKKVERFFLKLENDQMIDQQNVHVTTKLSVCNYSQYQDLRPTVRPTEQPPEHPTSVQDPSKTRPQPNHVNHDNQEKSGAGAPAPAKVERFDFSKSLIGLGIDKSVVTDWMAVRKTKKATNTKTAFNKIEREIGKSGMTANDAAILAVEKSWASFDSSWDGVAGGKKIKIDISKLGNDELLKMAQDLSISTQGLFRPDLISAIQGKIQ